MSDTHNTDRRRGQHDQRPEATTLDAQGSERDREDVKRRQDEAAQARAEQIKQAEDKAKERRGAMHEAAVKQQEEAFKTSEETYDKSRETMENRRKEEARLAAMSPAQRAEENERIAAMTPEERAKFFLETGRAIPLEQEGRLAPTQYASSYPILTQHQPPTEFVLSEANGQRSRGNCYLADPVIVYAGSLLKESAPATQLLPPTYILAATGADADAIALYGGTSTPTDGLRISAIVRDAEVNKHCVTWAPLAGAEVDAAIAQLATKGIICR
jgi:hypothetical protein